MIINPDSFFKNIAFIYFMNLLTKIIKNYQLLVLFKLEERYYIEIYKLIK